MLRLHLVPDKFISAIRKLYTDRTVQLFVGGTSCRSLPYNFGVIQGESLSAHLSIIFCNILPYFLDELSFEKTDAFVNNLLYVDDVVLIANSSKGAQKLLGVTLKISFLLGLVLNIKNANLLWTTQKRNFS